MTQVNAPSDLSRHIQQASLLTAPQQASWNDFADLYYPDRGDGLAYAYTWVEAYAHCATGRQLVGLQPLALWNYAETWGPTWPYDITALPRAIRFLSYPYCPPYFWWDICLQPIRYPGHPNDYTRRRRVALYQGGPTDITISNIPPGYYRSWVRYINANDGNTTDWYFKPVITVPPA
jgi:hypothetical protein